MIKAVIFDLDGTLLDRDTSLKRFVSAQYDRMKALHKVPKEVYLTRFIELDARGYVWKDLVYQSLIEEFELQDITMNEPLSDFKLLQADDSKLWQDGINTMPEEAFTRLGEQLFEWIKQQKHQRIFIVAHDGTITCYRALLGEQGLTRADFLGEAGFHRTIL